MMALGIGCRRNASAEDIDAIITQVLVAAALSVHDVDVIATETSKLIEPGLIEAARQHDLRLVGLDVSELAKVSDLAVTSSERVQQLKGVPSVAETAALAAVGREARLVVPRISNETVSCALAYGEGATQESGA